MGPLFVILIWGVLALIGLLAFVSLLVLFILACWKKNRWLKWLSGVPLALLALLCLTVIGTLTFGLIQSMHPASVFKQAFQTSPKGVTNLQSKYWFFGDSGHMYLRFNCSTQTLARILPQGLLETDEVTLKEKLAKGSCRTRLIGGSFRQRIPWAHTTCASPGRVVEDGSPHLKWKFWFTIHRLTPPFIFIQVWIEPKLNGLDDYTVGAYGY